MEGFAVIESLQLLGEIGSVASGLKAASDAVGDIRRRVKGNKDAEKELGAVQSSISALQTRVFELQQVVLGIQQDLVKAERENAQLREQISAKEERAAERKKYERKQVGHSTVMVKEGEPGAYFCATCFDGGKILPIQPLPQMMHMVGSHTCSICKGVFNLN